MKREEIEFLTPQAEVQIDRRVTELITEELQDVDKFRDLLAGIDPLETDSHLHRALVNLDKACEGEQIGLDAIRTALCHIQRRVYAEAVTVWTDKLRQRAERELFAEVV